MANKDPGVPTPSHHCRWLHDWGKWVVVQIVPAPIYVGLITTQNRACDRCGYFQVKLDLATA